MMFDLLGGSSETDTRVGVRVDRIKALQKLFTDDGVDAGAAAIVDPRVVLAACQAKVSILRGRNQILRRRQGERPRSNLEAKVGGWLGGEHSQARVGVGLAARCRQECVVGRSGDIDQRSAGVEYGRS